MSHPYLLQLLWLLPLIVGVLVYAHRKRVAAAEKFVGRKMLVLLMPPQSVGRAWLKGVLLIAAFILTVIALAGPQFGVYFENVAQRGADCFICLDVSRSMLAEDVKPNRLERAKSDILDLLKKLSGDRVGLIVFAGKAVVKVPITTDDGFFRQSLEEVDSHSAPRGGTLIGDAIRKAMESLPMQADRDQAIVLITDGEDQESMPLEAARDAAERGIKIFTIGLGDSREGARIPVKDSSGSRTFVKDEQGEHWSKVDGELLEKIALNSKGAYIPAGTRSYDLGEVYEKHLAGLSRSEDKDKQQRLRYREQYQVFLAFALALLAAERLIPRSTRKNENRGEQ
jgi:Ca-activated chloride channel family protein